MSAILPFVTLDSSALLAKHFTPYQANWIQAEEPIHAAGKRAFILAEKSVRIGWTFCDGFKNVRKRLHRKRDYLFVTKDYPSALEYMHQAYNFAELFELTRAIVSHGEEYHRIPRLDLEGNPTGFTDEIKMGVLKFDNGSRILAFSAHPQAMAVYGGDVGLDEFAKHPNAQLLWQTAQARVTWAGDLAVWSSHEGEDTLFNEFAQQARAGAEPWNLYYRVTMPDAIELGLLDLINRVQGASLTPEQFLADCRARSTSEEIFQQSYMCNPLGAATNHIVDWSALERCRFDYQIERAHLEHERVLQLFSHHNSSLEKQREQKIHEFLRSTFPKLLAGKPGSSSRKFRLGFDVAASGLGDLGAIYIDEPNGDELWLRALVTTRTEDWHFIRTVLYFFLRRLPNLEAAGDSSGLGRQICWQAAEDFSSRFLSVNLSSKKHDLGFALMNQLATAQKRLPTNQPDIASDFFALRKVFSGNKWAFSEAQNPLNLPSHCDIAWAGALASHVHTERKCTFGACVLMEDGSFFNGKEYRYPGGAALSHEQHLLWSEDPRIWRPLV